MLLWQFVARVPGTVVEAWLLADLGLRVSSSPGGSLLSPMGSGLAPPVLVEVPGA